MPMHDGRGWHRKEGSADYHGALCEPRHANARNVGSQQRSDRRTDRDADAADNLRHEEQSQSTALDGGHFHERFSPQTLSKRDPLPRYPVLPCSMTGASSGR